MFANLRERNRGKITVVRRRATTNGVSKTFDLLVLLVDMDGGQGSHSHELRVARTGAVRRKHENMGNTRSRRPIGYVPLRTVRVYLHASAPWIFKLM